MPPEASGGREVKPQDLLPCPFACGARLVVVPPEDRVPDFNAAAIHPYDGFEDCPLADCEWSEDELKHWNRRSTAIPFQHGGELPVQDVLAEIEELAQACSPIADDAEYDTLIALRDWIEGKMQERGEPTPVRKTGETLLAAAAQVRDQEEGQLPTGKR